MELITEFEEKLEKLNPVHAVGLFSIEARTLKSSLQPITERALTFMKRLLWKLMKEHVSPRTRNILQVSAGYFF